MRCLPIFLPDERGSGGPASGAEMKPVWRLLAVLLGGILLTGCQRPVPRPGKPTALGASMLRNPRWARDPSTISTEWRLQCEYKIS